MVIRSHRRRFWFRITPYRVWQPRDRFNASATSLIIERAPLSISAWLFRTRRGRPNRTGLGRRSIRLQQRRRRQARQRRQPRLRMAVEAPQRLFLPKRVGIHNGPVR
jgi:hypothetical protein